MSSFLALRCGSHRPGRSPGGFPTPYVSRSHERATRKVPLTLGSATRLGSPARRSQAQPLADRGGQTVHAPGRPLELWRRRRRRRGGRSQGQVQGPAFRWRRPHPRRGPPPQPGPGGCRVSAARRRVAAARDSGRPRAGGGAKRRLHDARRRPRCDSGDPRAAGYRLSPHLLDLAPQCPEPLAVLLLYLESFGQNVALRPRGCPRPWTSEPRGGLKSSGDRRAYLRCDLSGQRAHPSCRVLAGVPGQVAKEVVEALKGKCSRFCCLSTWVRAESGKPGIR